MTLTMGSKSAHASAAVTVRRAPCRRWEGRKDELEAQQQAVQTTRSAVREGEGSAAFEEARAGAAEE